MFSYASSVALVLALVMSVFARWIGTLRDQKDHQLTEFSTNRLSGELQPDDHPADRFASSKVQLAIPCSKGSEASNKLKDTPTPTDRTHDLQHPSVASLAPVRPRYWRLELSKSYRVMAQVLGLNRLQNYLQVRDPTLQTLQPFQSLLV